MSGYRFSTENSLTIFLLVLLLLLLVTFNSVATPPRAALPYRDTLIRNARLVWGLNAPIADFAAQIHHESSWKPDIIAIAINKWTKLLLMDGNMQMA